LQFITFIVNVMAAVHRHNALLKASIMSATNCHRLGANEAPPAIISIFTGSQLADILDRIENSTNDEWVPVAGKEELSMGLAEIPELRIDNTDRNRTSPFAFTGNRFEFRAVGSSANCASAMIALNAAVAEQLSEFKEKVDARLAKGEKLIHAILEEVRVLIKSSKAIHFDGNGYSEDWKEEAARRGLDCETNTPRIFDAYLRPETVDMFAKTKVMNEVELVARNEVKWEMYTKKIQIEARVLGDLALNHIVPVATRYLSILLDNMVKLRQLYPGKKGEVLTEQDANTVETIMTYTSEIKREVAQMVEARKVANRIECEREKAIAYSETVAPKLEEIRVYIDKLELMVDNQMWPLPKYRELLFIR
jgi:glutamine synthetase